MSSRYSATRRWLLRALTTPEAPTLQHELENAVAHRWLALSAVAAPLLTIAAVVVAFIYAWWAGVIAIIACIYLASLVGRSRLVPRDLEWYLNRFLAHAKRIERDCVRYGEPTRIAIAQTFVQQLTQVHRLYQGSSVPAPAARTAESIPLGDTTSLLEGRRV
jgi:hypothetical protein